MTRLYCIIFIVFSYYSSWTQGYKTPSDSLRNLISLSKEDTTKVNLLLSLGMLQEEEHPESALSLYDEALALSIKIKSPLLEAKSLIDKGIVNYLLGRWDDAIAAYKAAYDIALKHGMKKQIGASLVNIGNVYQAINNYPQTLHYYQEAEPYLSMQRQAVLASNMIDLFDRIGNIELSREYGYKAIKLSEQVGDTLSWLQAHNNMFSEKHDTLLHKGFVLIKKVLPYAKKLNDANLLVSLHYNVAIYYCTVNKPDSAILYCDIAEKYLKRAERAQSGMVDIYMLKSRIFLLKKEFHASKVFGLDALKLAPKSGIIYRLSDIYHQLAEAEEGLKNYSEAVNYYKLYNTYHDSTQSLRNYELTSQLDAQYQNQKKQTEINRLEQIKTEQLKELNQNRIIISVFVGVLMFISISGFLFYKNVKNKQRLAQQEQEIQKQKIEAFEKDKQILLANAIVAGQEEERGRLARDLHDGLGGMLWGIKSSLSGMKGNMILQGDQVQTFERSLDMLNNSITELRRVAHNLMPEALVKFGLTEALKDFCDFINNGKVMNVIFQQVGSPRRFDTSAEVILYRIANELANNAMRHSSGSELIVQLHYDDQTVSLTVEDNGAGFDRAILQKTTGAGWPNIKSRIEYLKGTLDFETEIGKGTAIYITIPA